MEKIKRTPSRTEFSRKTLEEKIAYTIAFIIFLVYAISLLYIVAFVFINSLKTPTEYFNDSFNISKSFLFSNYVKAFKELSVESAGFLKMLFNSIWWSLGHVILNLTPITLFSYVISRFDFKGKKILLFINYITIIVTVYGTQSADYAYFSDLHILNSPLMVIGALGGFGTTMLIVMSFFKSLSWDYAEAAEIDGANEFKIFLNIYVPLMAPIIGTLALTKFIACWNDYYGPLLYMDDFPTLSSGLYEYRIYSVERKGNYPIYFAGLLITISPVILLYSLFSNVIMENMGIGGIKG